jgi:membrane dipeptidase
MHFEAVCTFAKPKENSMRVLGNLFLFMVFFSLPTTCLGQRMDEAHRIQASVLGVDSHNDTLQRVLIEGVDIGSRLTDGQVDIPRLLEGGMHVPFFALWVPTYYKGSEAVRRTLDLRDAMQSVLDKYPDRIELATSARDIERIAWQRKIAAVLTIEGGHQIANDLAVLRTYRRMGILSMTLTHFRSNDWADSSTGEQLHNGLTDFGKQVVREMNSIGMIVDISHVSDKTFYDVLAVTSKPVIASHSSCFAFSDVPRNMKDDMLRALARNRGVVGVNFGASFLNQKDADELKQHVLQANAVAPTFIGAELDRFAAEQHAKDGESHAGVKNATVDDAADCIDHIVKIAGIEHVGIGSDFDGISSVPRGLEDVSKMPALTGALLKRGYKQQDIRKIMGENFLRVVRTVVGN